MEMLMYIVEMRPFFCLFVPAPSGLPIIGFIAFVVVNVLGTGQSD